MMNKPLWLEVLCSRRYNKRQQEILREIAELQERRDPLAKHRYVPNEKAYTP